MAIKQVIKYNSKNQYFAGFLQSIIKESEILGSVEQNGSEIVLLLDDKDSTKLEKFSLLTDKYLPHSIFLEDIKTTQEDIKLNIDDFKSESYNIGLCPKCLDALSDPANQDYLNDELQCTHYSNEPASYSDTTFFTPHYTNGCSILVTDASKVDELFIITDAEKKTLFSIEKPTIKVTIQDEELKLLCGENYINIKSPYNVRSTLASLNAKDSEMAYLFFQNNHDLDVIKVQENTSIIRANRVANKLEDFNKDEVLNRFLNIAKEANMSKKALAANMSVKHGISFLLSTRIEDVYAIEFQLFDLDVLLKNMKNDETQSRLLNNFKEKFPKTFSELEDGKNKNLFEVMCTILDLDTKENAFMALSDKSLEFRGNGGLKIDTFFKEDGFDYESFIGSIMSFQLAGVEKHYLAYSIFEAFGDMIISTLNQLKMKHKVDNFIMMGDMFENAILYSRILSKFQLSNPYFAKAIALDD